MRTEGRGTDVPLLQPVIRGIPRNTKVIVVPSAAAVALICSCARAANHRGTCAYPKYAHYKGQGDPEDAKNFGNRLRRKQLLQHKNGRMDFGVLRQIRLDGPAAFLLIVLAG
jgi:hypothetical protein